MGPAAFGNPEASIGDPFLVAATLVIRRKSSSDHLGGNAGGDGVGRNVLGHHRSGGDDGAAPDPRAGQQDGAEADPDIGLDVHFAISQLDGKIRISDPWCKVDRDSDAAIVVIVSSHERDAIRDEAVVADGCIGRDVDILADIDAIADPQMMGSGQVRTGSDVQLSPMREETALAQQRQPGACPSCPGQEATGKALNHGARHRSCLTAPSAEVGRSGELPAATARFTSRHIRAVSTNSPTPMPRTAPIAPKRMISARLAAKPAAAA